MPGIAAGIVFWPNFLIDFYPKIAARIFYFMKERNFPFELKYVSNRGFVNVVNVVDPYVVQKVFRTRVLLMLLMLLIFFGIFSPDFIVFLCNNTENQSHSGFVNVVDVVDPHVLKK